MSRLFLLLVLGLSASGAQAKLQADGPAFSPERGLDLSTSFEAQRSAILTALNDGKTYVEISADDSRQVRESLDRISAKLDGKQTINDINHADRVDVFNEQERINGLLTRAHDDSRMVCRREKPTGSNRSVNTCLTVAERRRIRDEIQGEMKNWRSGEPRPEVR